MLYAFYGGEMTVYDIEAVLNNRLMEYANDPLTTIGMENVQWGNMEYTPVTGVPYIAGNFVPASSAPVGVGQESLIREIGFYQLSVAVPGGDGKALIKSIIAELHQYFKQGLVLALDGVEVRIQRFRIFNAFSSPDWYVQILRVEWRSDISNQ
jgi:hypothetical protein